MSETLHYARTLSQRFTPHGVSSRPMPAICGVIWPPRLVVHEAVGRATATAELRFTRRQARAVTLDMNSRFPLFGPAGLCEGAVSVSLSEASRAPCAEGTTRLAVTLSWGKEVGALLAELPWVAQPVRIEVRDPELRGPGATRVFWWCVYLTRGAPVPTLSESAVGGPVRRWIDRDGAECEGPDGLGIWVNLRGTLLRDSLNPGACADAPACWCTGLSSTDGEAMPIQLLAQVPDERNLMGPALDERLDAATRAQGPQEWVGVDGTMGGVEHLPAELTIARPILDRRRAQISYCSFDASGAIVSREIEFDAHDIVPVRVPQIRAPKQAKIQLYRLSDELRGERARADEVRIRVPVHLTCTEGVRLVRASLMLHGVQIGEWEVGTGYGGPTVAIERDSSLVLPLLISPDKISRDGVRQPTLFVEVEVLRGARPCTTRLEVQGELLLDLRRISAPSVQALRPVIVVDLGTDMSCVAVGLEDTVGRVVVAVEFDDGPLVPTRVHFHRVEGSSDWTIDPAGDSAYYTSQVKFGLLQGDSAHRGAPGDFDGLAVAGEFLRHLLQRVKERAGWFPLAQADVLFSFPPRLACIPAFSRSLERVANEAVVHVFGPRPERRVVFREEAFLAAVEQLRQAGTLSDDVFYWILDIGGGTSDACGFLARPKDAVIHISHLTYPTRLDNHLAGNDVTAAFYERLRARMSSAGLVAGEGTTSGLKVPIPKAAFPSFREDRPDEHHLANQAALLAWAEAIKRAPIEAEGQPSPRVMDLCPFGELFRADRSLVPRSSLLQAWLSAEKAFADWTAAELRAEVLAEGLGERLTRFSQGVVAALSSALDRLPSTPPPVVRVLLAGRGALFAPLRSAFEEALRARQQSGALRTQIESDAWWRREWRSDRYEPAVEMKLVTALGGAEFYLDVTAPDYAPILLEFEHRRMDCPVFLGLHNDVVRFDLCEELPLAPHRAVHVRPGAHAAVGHRKPLVAGQEIGGRGVNLMIDGIDDYADPPVLGTVEVPRGGPRRTYPKATDDMQLEVGADVGEFILRGLIRDEQTEELHFKGAVHLLPLLAELGP